MKFKRPTKLPAPEYVDALMNWAQGLLDNEEIFPNRIGKAKLEIVMRSMLIMFSLTTFTIL